jgi:hypothetical protein
MNVTAEDHGHVSDIGLIEPERRRSTCPHGLLGIEHHPTAEIVTIRKVSVFDESEVDPSAVVRCSGGTGAITEELRLRGTVTTHRLTDVHEGFVDLSEAVEVLGSEGMMKLHEPIQVLLTPSSCRVVLVNRPVCGRASDRAIELRRFKGHLVDPLVIHSYSAEPRIRVSALNVDHYFWFTFTFSGFGISMV